MGLKLGSLLKVAAPIAANYFVPGSGALVAGVMGGMGSKKSAKNTFADVLRQARPNQTNEMGDQLSWSTDPKTGQPVQTVNYSPERKQQLDSINTINNARLDTAKGIDLSRYGNPTMGIDWESLGLGALAKGAGVAKEGTTGKMPWADSKYASLGGDALRNLQFSEGQLPVSQTWGSKPMGG